jgi:hypothetical protein
MGHGRLLLKQDQPQQHDFRDTLRCCSWQLRCSVQRPCHSRNSCEEKVAQIVTSSRCSPVLSAKLLQLT